jgi:SAM-dependent methyltransferase
MPKRMAGIEFWHRRYRQQAAWTSELRAHLLRKCALRSGSRVLDTGSGTGVLLAEMREIWNVAPWAIDIDFNSLAFAARQASAAVSGGCSACADVRRLPFAGAVFDASYCHFLLLWVNDPVQALREMRRVTRPGGSLLVLAEPDYGGRIDYPPELGELGSAQREALRRQGADPSIGRRLHGLMHAAGLQNVETGLLGGAWTDESTLSVQTLEWEVLEQDLKDFVPYDKMKTLRRRDEQAWQAGERILYVPTFFSIGRGV